MEPQDCYRKEVVLDLFKVVNLMETRYAADAQRPGLDIHDAFLVDIWPTWYDNRPNDAYWHLYRHWIPTDDGKLLWDLMCLELGLTSGDATYEDKIVFWVSW
jgi:hypothetical protein